MAKINESEDSYMLSRSRKEKKDKQWFKDKITNLSKIAFAGTGTFGYSSGDGYTVMSDYRRMKINYDLFNNILNKADFEKNYPFVKGFGELPVDFTNKDIIAGKIKAVIGLEMKRPLPWKVVAVNPEATTRKEQEEFSRLKEYVVNSIIEPIKQQLELEAQEATKGRELSEEEAQEIQNQISEQLQTMTPEEVKKYMMREHQDPAEILAVQILEYIMMKEDVATKFNTMWKHGLISGKEIAWIGVVNGEPKFRPVNPMYFDYDKSSQEPYIEDGEWASYRMNMLPSEVTREFGSELSDVELEELFEDFNTGYGTADIDFNFDAYGEPTSSGIRVLHCEWKAPKAIKFVSGIDPFTGEEYLDMVDEMYKIDYEAGDIAISTEWITSKYEGYLIGEDKYAFLREVPGQHKDLDNLHICKLSYMGAIYDDMNSEPTSLVDRMKYYQYMYNVLVYKVEELVASDDGIKLFINGNVLPKKSGLPIEKWLHFLKVNKIGILDPSEEGSKGNQNIGEAVKAIDMSLASDISKYIELAEYIERRCGETVGITKQVEGQIQEREAVRNTQISLSQSANILEPYFAVHNNVKRNILEALLEAAKVAYVQSDKEFLSYVLDDMSVAMLRINKDLLDNSSYGLFISNSSKAYEALETIKQLTQAAMQNQMIELSDVLTISNSSSTQEASELLKVAEQKKAEERQAAQESQQKAMQEEGKAARDWEREKIILSHENIMEQIGLKGDIDLQKQVILSMGFNQDKDLDKDGVPDVLEVYKAGIDADIKARKQDLEEAKFIAGKKEHKDKMELEQKKLQSKVAKNVSKT